MNKVYVIIENNDGNSKGLGDFVIMKGIYNSKYEAKGALEKLNSSLDNRGFLKEATDNTRYLFDNKGFLKEVTDNTRYLYSIEEVELGKETNIYLGGYSK